MKLEFDGTKDEFQTLVGGAVLQMMLQIQQQQQRQQTPPPQHSEGWAQMQPLSLSQGHLPSYTQQQPQPTQHLPALPPSYSQPVSFAEYRQAQIQYAQSQAEYQQPTQGQIQTPVSTIIPQPFVPTTQPQSQVTSSAIVPATMTAEIVQVEQSTSQVKAYLQSFYQWLYSPTASVISVVLFAAACWFLLVPIAKDIKARQSQTTTQQVEVKPSPTPVIQASPKPQAKPKTQPKQSKSVSSFPCLPLPVTEKGC
jgi:hypothetical protein